MHPSINNTFAHWFNLFVWLYPRYVHSVHKYWPHHQMEIVVDFLLYQANLHLHFDFSFVLRWPCAGDRMLKSTNTLSVQSLGVVWKSRWPSRAFRPNEPYGFCGRKATLNHAHALASARPCQPTSEDIKHHLKKKHYQFPFKMSTVFIKGFFYFLFQLQIDIKIMVRRKDSLQCISDVTEVIQHAVGWQWDRGDNSPQMHVRFCHFKFLCYLFSHIRHFGLKMSAIYWDHQHTLWKSISAIQWNSAQNEASHSRRITCKHSESAW